MKKIYRNLNVPAFALISLTTALAITGCNSGSTGNNPSAASNSATASKIATSTSSTNNCVTASFNESATSTQYWFQGTLYLVNSCNESINLSKLTVTLTSQDSPPQNSESPTTPSAIALGRFIDWWVDSGDGDGVEYDLDFVAGPQTNQQIGTLAGVGTTIYANQTLSFDAQFELYGNPYNMDLAQSTLTLQY